jgi:TolB-like protein
MALQGMALDAGFKLGDRVVEPSRCCITGPDGERHVEPRAMQVLLALARRPGETLSRDELIEAVWKHPHVSDEALSHCISMLRQALGDERAQPRFVQTLPKRGYRLLPTPQPAAAAAVALAVLPLLNLSGDPGEEHLADGITELLISNLACMSRLRVISRTSAMHYKGTRARLTEIARELDVTRVVEGSVLRSGRQLQVVVQLIDPATDMHLFARNYTRELADVLRLQNEMAWQIAEEIGHPRAT